MAITAKQIMELAGLALNDVEAVRWTYPELCSWINEAVGAVVLARPSSSSQTVVLSLQAGTQQSIPATALQLLRVIRNISTEGPPRVGGRFVGVTSRATLDAQLPTWHDPTKTPYKREVRQVVVDEAVPREFYVYPGNDGTGKVEVAVSVMPAKIGASGDPTLLASYDLAIGLPDIYLTPLFDYVLYRALSKDSTEASPTTAAAHFQAFALTLGVKAQNDANSPNLQGAAQAVTRGGG